jgi:hypothetical protein
VSTATDIPNCDVTMMARTIQPERGDLSLAAARAFLKFEFSPQDQERMGALMVKARAGALTADEDKEMDDYERVIHLLAMMHSKARKAIKNRKRTSA